MSATPEGKPATPTNDITEIKGRCKMVEHCPDHSQLMQNVGEICGAVKSLVTGQETLFGKLDDLAKSNASIKTDLATHKTQLRPLFWVVTAAGLVIIDVVVRMFIK